MAARICLLLPLLAVVGCGGPEPEPWPPAPGPKVLVSFAPIRCFALNVGGDAVAVKAVMSTQGPHHFQPGRDDARRLASADLFLINGLGLDDGIAAKMHKLGGGTNAKLAKIGEAVPEAMRLEGGCGCEHEHEEGHVHDHGHVTDPHVWLGPEQAIKMVERIRDELKTADPAHATDYDRRAAEYVGKLQKLHADGKAMLAGKAERRFVTFHGSMAYFAKGFGLDEPEVIQNVAGSEPSPKELKELVDRCVQKKLRVIAVEPQYSAGTSAKVIVAELQRRGNVDPVTVVLDPMETATDEAFNADWYVTTMRANLDALAKALK